MLLPIRQFAQVTSSCGTTRRPNPRTRRKGRSATSVAVRGTSSPTGLGLSGSSERSGFTGGHQVAGSHHQHQRVTNVEVFTSESVGSIPLNRAREGPAGVRCRPAPTGTNTSVVHDVDSERRRSILGRRGRGTKRRLSRIYAVLEQSAGNFVRRTVLNNGLGWRAALGVGQKHPSGTSVPFSSRSVCPRLTATEPVRPCWLCSRVSTAIVQHFGGIDTALCSMASGMAVPGLRRFSPSGGWRRRHRRRTR